MKILFVIDYQNDFVDGALGFDGAKDLDMRIASRVREYGNDRVFYTLDTHGKDYSDTLEGKKLPITHCIKGTKGHELYGETAKALLEVGAKGFEKESFGLKITEEIRKELPQNVEQIELCGLVSNICVISNAVILRTEYPNAEIVVDSALTACADEEMNKKALDVMAGFQVKII